MGSNLGLFSIRVRVRIGRITPGAPFDKLISGRPIMAGAGSTLKSASNPILILSTAVGNGRSIWMILIKHLWHITCATRLG